MPTQAERRKRGGVVKIRTKRMKDGTLLRVYVYRKKGPKGGSTTADKVTKGKK